MRPAVVFAMALAFAPAAHAGTTVTNPLTQTTLLGQTSPRTTKAQAIELFLVDDKVADWLRRTLG